MTNEEPYCERPAGGFLRPNRAITLLRLVFQTQPRSGDGGRDIFTGKGGGVNHGWATQECIVKRTENLPGTLAYAYVRLNTLICGGARSGRADGMVRIGRGKSAFQKEAAEPGGSLLLGTGTKISRIISGYMGFIAFLWGGGKAPNSKLHGKYGWPEAKLTECLAHISAKCAGPEACAPSCGRKKRAVRLCSDMLAYARIFGRGWAGQAPNSKLASTRLRQGYGGQAREAPKSQAPVQNQLPFTAFLVGRRLESGKSEPRHLGSYEEKMFAALRRGAATRGKRGENRGLTGERRVGMGMNSDRQHSTSSGSSSSCSRRSRRCRRGLSKLNRISTKTHGWQRSWVFSCKPAVTGHNRIK